MTYYSLKCTGTRDGREEHYADYTVDGTVTFATDPDRLLDDAEDAFESERNSTPNLTVDRGPNWLRVSYTLDGETDGIEKVDEYVVQEHRCAAEIEYQAVWDYARGGAFYPLTEQLSDMGDDLLERLDDGARVDIEYLLEDIGRDGGRVAEHLDSYNLTDERLALLDELADDQIPANSLAWGLLDGQCVGDVLGEFTWGILTHWALEHLTDKLAELDEEAGKQSLEADD